MRRRGVFVLALMLAATGSFAAGAPAPLAGQAGAVIQKEKASGLELDFASFPWRPDVFQGFEAGGASAHSWAFARLVVSAYFTIDGTKLYPGHYAMVLNPRMGALPMTLELRRVDSREFLGEPPAMPPPPAGETVYKAPVTFTPGAEPNPVLNLTLASWSDGALLTIRYGDRKLAKELLRSSP